jgi:DNA-binding transcriptional LysR family regulator
MTPSSTDQRLVNQFTAAKAGIGLALLPCYLGDEDKGLVRALSDPVPDLVGELWLVTHADLSGPRESAPSRYRGRGACP